MYEVSLESMSQWYQSEESYPFGGGCGDDGWDMNDDDNGYYAGQALYAENMTNPFINNQAQMGMDISSTNPTISTQMDLQASFCDPSQIHNGAVPAL